MSRCIVSAFGGGRGRRAVVCARALGEGVGSFCGSWEAQPVRGRPPMRPGDRSDGGRPPACPGNRRDRNRPPACPEKHGQLGPATASAHRHAVTSARADSLGRNRCRSVTERATATAARLRRRSEAARPSAAVNAAKRFCLPHTQQRGLRRSCLLVSHLLGSIAGDHRLHIPFFAGGRVTYRRYLTSLAIQLGLFGRVVARTGRFHASSDGSVVPLAEEKEASA